VDFMLSAAGGAVILEINTLPGLTPTSLLPKSASCRGYSFGALVRALVGPALARFTATRAAA
jgi:D-alanine-D-alanine ligase